VSTLIFDGCNFVHNSTRSCPGSGDREETEPSMTFRLNISKTRSAKT